MNSTRVSRCLPRSDYLLLDYYLGMVCQCRSAFSTLATDQPILFCALEGTSARIGRQALLKAGIEPICVWQPGPNLNTNERMGVASRTSKMNSYHGVQMSAEQLSTALR